MVRSRLAVAGGKGRSPASHQPGRDGQAADLRYGVAAGALGHLPLIRCASMPDDRSPPPPLPFLKDGFAQTALVVRDLDRTVEDYWRTFGVGPWHFYTYGPDLLQQQSYQGRPAAYTIRIALTWTGPSRVELIEIVGGDSVYADFVAEHGYGVQHLGVLVDDMAEAIAQAQAAGIKMIQDGSGFGADGDGHFAYLDTQERFGVTIELIRRPRERLQPEKVFPPGTQGLVGEPGLEPGTGRI